MKNTFVLLLGVSCIVYLLNPGAGFFELIPDNLPLVGNLDDGLVLALLIMCLQHFGIKLPDIFSRKKE
ncbi:MAG: DUF1232 domain-containing protein [Syntrophotaleaceae bacterium]